MELRFSLAAALLQSTGLLERRIMTSVSKEARCRHCHTHRTEAGMTWGEAGQKCPQTWLGVIGHPGSVLCSASALPRYKGYTRDKMEVISPKGSYKDECTKQSVSVQSII